jgi:hypothetical protein
MVGRGIRRLIASRSPPVDLNRALITRQHVVGLLPLMNLTPEQEARLLALRYPVEFGVAAAAFESLGVDLDTLTDRMGGSP